MTCDHNPKQSPSSRVPHSLGHESRGGCWAAQGKSGCSWNTSSQLATFARGLQLRSALAHRLGLAGARCRLVLPVAQDRKLGIAALVLHALHVIARVSPAHALALLLAVVQDRKRLLTEVASTQVLGDVCGGIVRSCAATATKFLVLVVAEAQEGILLSIAAVAAAILLPARVAAADALGLGLSVIQDGKVGVSARVGAAELRQVHRSAGREAHAEGGGHGSERHVS
mmetsp:Transcript_20431/g.70763  ORF Transcript_20431/g.70763 Transcript_20431/m.70763 type:complete len:227 (+) Transcript_20431:53-733(+)